MSEPGAPRTGPTAPGPTADPVARPQPRLVASTLGIFAGSGPFEASRLEAGVALLEARGFRVVRAPGIEARTGFFAGDDENRAAGIRELLERDDVDALIAARGGYGLTRILGRLDPEAFGAAGKPVLGFSDVTALHALLLPHGVEAMHGPVVTQLAELPSSDVDALVDLLHGRPPTPVLADGPALAPGRAEGVLWGGNLAVLTALVGTPYLRPPPDGFILLLEDVGEPTYRLDRLLTQLLTSGTLDAARGVVLGDFVDCAPRREDHPTAQAVLAERLAGLGIPVLAGLPIGHGSRNRAVPLGRLARLDADAGRLELGP